MVFIWDISHVNNVFLDKIYLLSFRETIPMRDKEGLQDYR